MTEITDNCNLIIAFFPDRAPRVDTVEVERLLRRHSVRVERVESTERGVLVFAESTQCGSLDLTNMREALGEQARAVGYRVRLHRECLFRAMHSLVQNF